MALATCISPLLWVISSGELTKSYSLAIESLTVHAKHLMNVDVPAVVRQFHCDLTQTAEGARVELLKNSIRASDFWHLVELIKEKLVAFCDMTDLIHGTGQYYREVLQWITMTRTQCFTLTEMHGVWALLFKHYSSLVTWPDGSACMTTLQELYCVKIPVEQACAAYNVKNPTMMVDGCLWCPLWWCGVQRLEPGSANGSQSCASNHRHWFGPLFLDKESGCPVRNAEPPQILESLGVVVRVTGQQMN